MKIPHTVAARALISVLVVSSFSFAEDGTPLTGAEVINNNCSRCHNARPVEEFSLKDWSVIMPHMRQTAHLTGAETRAAMAYFQMLGRQPPPELGTVLPSATSGEELITRYGCQGCQSLRGKGGSVGPALDGVVQRKGADFVRRKIANPHFNNPQSAMPQIPLTEVEIKTLTNYLAGQ